MFYDFITNYNDIFVDKMTEAFATSLVLNNWAQEYMDIPSTLIKQHTAYYK